MRGRARSAAPWLMNLTGARSTAAGALRTQDGVEDRAWGTGRVCHMPEVLPRFRLVALARAWGVAEGRAKTNSHVDAWVVGAGRGRDDGPGEEGGEGRGVEGALEWEVAVRSGLGGGFSSSESSLGLKSKASSRSDSFKSA